MDWENIREFLGTVNGAYAAGAAGVVITSVVGYVSGRLSSKNRKETIIARQNYELESKRLDLEQGKIEVEKAKTYGDPVKLRELEYADNASQRADQIKETELERNAVRDEADRSRKIELEDSNRSRAMDLEDIARREASQQAERDHRITLAKELSGALGPVIEAYADAIRSYHSATPHSLGDKEDPNAVNRAKYRAELVDEFIEALANRKDDSDNDLNIANEEFDISEEDMNRIGRMVDVKYPNLNDSRQEPKMPAELVRLLSLIPNVSSSR